MSTATQLKVSMRRSSNPLRAGLHAALLRGLRPPRLPHEPGWAQAQIDRQALLAFEVRGARGQRLAAWLALPAAACSERPVPVVVAVHGWGANGSTLAPMVQPLMCAGMAVVLFDVSNHGDSSWEEFSSLPRFAEDLSEVLVTLREVPSIDTGRAALLGHSVGAAAVLLHASRHAGTRAVISLSAFANPRDVMAQWLQEHHIPRRWIGAAILEHVQAVIGERFDRIAPENRVPHIDCPVLLVHGARDRTIPLSNAYRLKSLLRQGDLLVVDGDHDLRVSLKSHTDRLVDFFNTHLQVSAGSGSSP